jgi:hypothetical protein
MVRVAEVTPRRVPEVDSNKLDSAQEASIGVMTLNPGVRLAVGRFRGT